MFDLFLNTICGICVALKCTSSVGNLKFVTITNNRFGKQKHKNTRSCLHLRHRGYCVIHVCNMLIYRSWFFHIFKFILIDTFGLKEFWS